LVFASIGAMGGERHHALPA